MFQSFVKIKAKPVDLVQRALITKSIIALIRDLLLPNQFLFRPRQFFTRQTIVREFVDFIEQRSLHRLNFLRIGTEIKGEQSRHQTLHLVGTYIIGEPHLLTNAYEKA